MSMVHSGLALSTRYSYPPNSLSLCGPAKQKDLAWYSQTQQVDAGSKEIMQQFSTLYPYLCFIAAENHLKDPFDRHVIEAYWLGNVLLKQTRKSDFLHFLDDGLSLSRKLSRQGSAILKQKVAAGGLPHHAFHVLNVYRRTGHLDIKHTIDTMDACIINWGIITEIQNLHLIVSTQPLRLIKDKLAFGPAMKRKLRWQGEKDVLAASLVVGDMVSYHWGYVCEKLTQTKLKNLKLYTNLALHFANQTI